MKKRSKSKQKPAAPKAAARTPAPKVETPKVETPKAKVEAAPAAIRREPTMDEIRARAYQRFLNRGGAPGHMIEDWVAAERELKADRN